MKNFNLVLIFLVFTFAACQNNADFIETEIENPSSEAIETMELSWWAIVEEEESLHQWGDPFGTAIDNASVKLMFKGEQLWSSTTNESGRFEFEEMTVPAQDAYFLFEAPGYFPLVVGVEEERIPLWRVNMIRNTFQGIDGEALSTDGSYITLRGQLQDPSTAREAWFYLTNSNNELLGNAVVGPELPRFYMTTLPDVELFLHYHVECGGSGVLPLGSFSESQDIGNLLDQSLDFSFDYDRVSLNNVLECSTGTKLFGYELFYKAGNLSFQATGNSGFTIPDCPEMDYPILLSVATQNPRKYAEVSINHSPGQNSDAPDQEVCEDDDTFLKYTIAGGSEKGGDVFTYVNILPDGQMVLKQASLGLTNEDRFSMVINGSSTGNHSSDLKVVVREVSGSGSWTYKNSLGAHQLNTTISTNDDKFIEGSISGEVMNTEGVSLGVMEGTFKARIQ